MTERWRGARGSGEQTGEVGRWNEAKVDRTGVLIEAGANWTGTERTSMGLESVLNGMQSAGLDDDLTGGGRCTCCCGPVPGEQKASPVLMKENLCSKLPSVWDVDSTDAVRQEETEQVRRDIVSVGRGSFAAAMAPLAGDVGEALCSPLVDTFSAR